jgi:sensor c-di-GMP phosphodiesterase-like protein
MSYAARRERQIALILVPFGLVCGALLAWANVYVSRKRLSLAGILRAGVRRREFYVEYQPVVELATGRWVGAEALVRWRRGKRIMRPDMFIPIAEETGLITGITECVFEVVSRDLPQILAVDSEFSVAINLSAADLGSEKTLRLVNRTLKESGAKPDNLEVEATERGFLQGAEARAVITAIRERGVAVAIDDFGTGYSSLSRLQELPLDVLKIDKSFVDAVGTDGVTSQVVLHIIEMAQSLKLDLVAEGVETEDQAAFLRENGVTYAQGWLFGKPMAVTSLCTALAARAARIDEVCA